MPSELIVTLRLITKPNLPPGHDGCVPHAVLMGVIDSSDWLILAPVARLRPNQVAEREKVI